MSFTLNPDHDFSLVKIRLRENKNLFEAINGCCSPHSLVKVKVSYKCFPTYYYYFFKLQVHTKSIREAIQVVLK